MRAHVGNGCGLPGCLGGGRRGRSANLARGRASDEPTADLFRDVEFTAGKCPRSGDGVARTAIARSFDFEQPQHALCAVRRPRGDGPPVSFTQCLRRAHPDILPALSSDQRSQLTIALATAASPNGTVRGSRRFRDQPAEVAVVAPAGGVADSPAQLRKLA